MALPLRATTCGGRELAFACARSAAARRDAMFDGSPGQLWAGDLGNFLPMGKHWHILSGAPDGTVDGLRWGPRFVNKNDFFSKSRFGKN